MKLKKNHWLASHHSYVASTACFPHCTLSSNLAIRRSYAYHFFCFTYCIPRQKTRMLAVGWSKRLALRGRTPSNLIRTPQFSLLEPSPDWCFVPIFHFYFQDWSLPFFLHLLSSLDLSVTLFASFCVISNTLVSWSNLLAGKTDIEIHATIIAFKRHYLVLTFRLYSKQCICFVGWECFMLHVGIHPWQDILGV